MYFWLDECLMCKQDAGKIYVLSHQPQTYASKNKLTSTAFNLATWNLGTEGNRSQHSNILFACQTYNAFVAFNWAVCYNQQGPGTLAASIETVVMNPF